MNDDEHVDNDETGIAARYQAIRARADAAALGAGRKPDDVKIIGVTKLKPAAMIRHAATAGITDVGENYVQELAAKHEELGDIVRWHFIGSLQRNKVRSIAPFVALVHSVDSEKLGAEIDRQAAAHGRRIPVLLEVNTSNEPSKAGIAPEHALELARALTSLGNIELRGMMTIAAFLDDAEIVRPMFRLLRELRDHTATTLGIELPHLSMGMTNDFEVAIAEGATMVRIGTAIFGRR
jgi:pyridoxal phosphate enzyme (YggS family)